VKYLPYPPLQRITYGCQECPVTAVVFTHYAEAYDATVYHRCRKTKRDKKLERR
jgi:hypothetical protein